MADKAVQTIAEPLPEKPQSETAPAPSAAFDDEDDDEDSITPEQVAVNEKLLSRCLALDLTGIRTLLDKLDADAWWQDQTTCESCLHAVIRGLHLVRTTSATTIADAESTARECLSVLLAEGAVWYAPCGRGETPGCLARRLGEGVLYKTIVDAGVRAELLLRALSTRTPTATPNPQTYLNAPVTYTTPLQDTHTLLDSDGNAVMMSWETPIMERSAALLFSSVRGEVGGVVLNIGFGLGIIDSIIQEQHSPALHIIVEAHPDVLHKMRATGWMERPSVVVLEGRWQDHVESIGRVLGERGEEVLLDGIYYDPFGESFDDFLSFADQVVTPFLRPPADTTDLGGTFSFFNGFGADRQTFYDVYLQVTQIELLEYGLGVEYEMLDGEALPQNAGRSVGNKDEPVAGDIWKGTSRKYWDIPGGYQLPTVRFTPPA
ncbi:Arginine N-methyltransferase 2 [Savitreella phatthalungensis]